MKKLLIAVLALVLLLALSGCSKCEHVWTEADCLNAAVCTECEEVGEPALGHDFAAASCEIPETCTRCGETQGEALGHTFGEWAFQRGAKTRACEACGTEESETIDDETYMKHLLTGHWDMMFMIVGGEQYSPYNLKDNVLGQTVDYNGDTLSYYNSTDTEMLTVAFTEFDEEADIFYGSATFDDGSAFLLMLQNIDGTYYLSLAADQNNFIGFSQNKEVVDLMEGTWAVLNGDSLYSFHFSPDGTFTGNMGEDINGVWQVRPIYNQYGSVSCDILLNFELDGQEQFQIYNLHLDYHDDDESIDVDWNNAQYSSQLGRYFDEYSTYLYFLPVTEEDIAELEQAAQDAKTAPLGTWTSTHFSYYASQTTKEESTTDFSVVFHEDGTFTLNEETVLTGTWEFSGATANYGNASYDYDLTIEGISQGNSSATLNTYDNSLRVYYYDGTASKNFSFAQLTEEEVIAYQEAPALFPGEWVSVEVGIYDYEVEEYVTTEETGYTMTISEDGTYTAMLDQEVSGTWTLYDIDFENNVSRIMVKDPEGYGQTVTLEPDGRLCVSHEFGDQWGSIYFVKK